LNEHCCLKILKWILIPGLMISLLIIILLKIFVPPKHLSSYLDQLHLGQLSILLAAFGAIWAVFKFYHEMHFSITKFYQEMRYRSCEKLLDLAKRHLHIAVESLIDLNNDRGTWTYAANNLIYQEFPLVK